MVGENFEIYASQMAKNPIYYPPCLKTILKFSYLKWLKIQKQ